ncbi:G5 domain-containing protein [Fundicoccus sp. Sow4_D5]|uniref:G5 domain-containing protein n=1 Tax=Fundicoccus sp. Sow4_D5 TaxID=3438782 RepID=UPI003F924926
MRRSISRRDYHSTGAKIMRKLKGKGWVAASTGLAVLTGLSVAVSPIQAASPQAVESVLKSVLSSDFEEKSALVENEAIKEESSKALDKVTNKWTANSVEDIRSEIQRQKDAGLDAYVIQWGDTLSILAAATDQDTVLLGNLNGITNRDFIITGDILSGILEVEILPTASQTPVQNVVVAPKAPNQVEQPAKPVVPTTPVTPETPVVPEKPTVPSEPAEPDTPEVLAEPSVPEAQVYVDEVIQEHTVEDATHTVLSEEILYGGESGEEITTVAGERYILSTDTVEISRDIKEEETTTETYTEEIPEIFEGETEVQVGDDENGEPIYEQQFVKEATGNMLTIEHTREVVVSPASTTVVSQTTTIYGLPFNVITQYDNTLEVGTQEVIQEGIEGQLSSLSTKTTVNDVVTETSSATETTLVSPQDKIIKVGTKEVIGSKKIVLNSTVTTRGLIHRTDPTLYEDEGSTIEGQDGFVKTTVEIVTIGEETTETIIDEETQEAVSDIKIIGTKPIVTTEKITVERPIAFETEYKEFPGSDKTETILQKGVNGLAIDTYLVTYTKGIEDKRELLNSEVSLKPITEIIQIGSVTSEVYRKELAVEEKVIAPEVYYNYNPDLTSDVPVTTREGVDGLVNYHYEISYNNAGEEIGRILIGEEKITEALPKLVEVGSNLVEIKTSVRPTQTTDAYNILFHRRLSLTESFKITPDMMSDFIEIIEDSSLSTGEIVVVDEGSLGLTQFSVAYYNGQPLFIEDNHATEIEQPRKKIIRVGTNANSFAEDVVNPNSIKWMGVEIKDYQYDQDGNTVYDETGEPVLQTITVDIPDLNLYFKENARKFSAIDLTQDQLKAIDKILNAGDSSYKLDEEYLYGTHRLKGEYYSSLFNKTSHYLELFNVKHSYTDFQDQFHNVRFNEDDFELELDLKPELITTVYNPTVNFAYAEPTLTLIDSKYEKGSLIETFTMIEETSIDPGYTSILDPTKFYEELTEWIDGEFGKLTRTFEVVKKDGIASSRKLIDYDLNPATNHTLLQGIRGGFGHVPSK